MSMRPGRSAARLGASGACINDRERRVYALTAMMAEFVAWLFYTGELSVESEEEALKLAVGFCPEATSDVDDQPVDPAPATTATVARRRRWRAGRPRGLRNSVTVAAGLDLQRPAIGTATLLLT